MDFDRGRMTNPTAETLPEAGERFAELGRLVVQFDDVSAYTPELLGLVNELCRASSEPAF